MIYKDLEIVVLTHDMDEYNLKKGDAGTIVDVYGNGEAYELEFIESNGITKALITVDSADITSSEEIVPIIDWRLSELGNNMVEAVSNKNESSTEALNYQFPVLW